MLVIGGRYDGEGRLLRSLSEENEGACACIALHTGMIARGTSLMLCHVFACLAIEEFAAGMNRLAT